MPAGGAMVGDAELPMAFIPLARIVPILARYGYMALLPIAVVEGPAMAMIAGALVAAGQLNGVSACLLLVAADLVGDAGYYGLGRYGHAPLLARISKRLKLTPERLAPLERRFHDNDWKLLMIGKTQALGSIILYFAGASRMSFLRYLLFNLVGTFPKVVLFELVGYFLWRSVLESTHYIDIVTVALFGLALVLLVFYWLVRRYLWKDLVDDISK
jgi:membrane protein DedA with SNARE-associated domain